MLLALDREYSLELIKIVWMMILYVLDVGVNGGKPSISGGCARVRGKTLCIG